MSDAFCVAPNTGTRVQNLRSRSAGIDLCQCDGVTLQNITSYAAPAMTINSSGSGNVVIDGLEIRRIEGRQVMVYDSEAKRELATAGIAAYEPIVMRIAAASRASGMSPSCAATAARRTGRASGMSPSCAATAARRTGRASGLSRSVKGNPSKGGV